MSRWARRETFASSAENDLVEKALELWKDQTKESLHEGSNQTGFKRESIRFFSASSRESKRLGP